jgi:hypothetical protein
VYFLKPYIAHTGNNQILRFKAEQPVAGTEYRTGALVNGA